MRLAIVGGSHAGVACALKAAEAYPGAEIILFEKQEFIGFVAQSIPLYLMGDEDALRALSYTTTEELVAQGIQVRVKSEVRQVGVAAKTLTYATAGNALSTEHWDKLVIATGSYPHLPLVTGHFDDKVYVVKQYSDAVEIKALMKVAKRVIVIGGGAIGIEMSRALAGAGIEVTLLQSASTILDRYLDDDIANVIEGILAHSGIHVHTGAVVVDITAKPAPGAVGRTLRVTTEDGRAFEADGVIYATGFRPNSRLVAGQVALGAMGAIVVDGYMHTSAPDVFAAGDCATTEVTNVADPSYIPHASDAIRQGEIAASNLQANRVRVRSSQGTYSLNFKGLVLSMTGLPAKRARQQGLDVAVAHHTTAFDRHSEKYAEMWLVYERGTHRIIGFQTLGAAPELASYADIMSLAIQQRLTIEDLEYTDFYYKHGYENPRTFTKIMADAVRAQAPGQRP